MFSLSRRPRVGDAIDCAGGSFEVRAVRERVPSWVALIRRNEEYRVLYAPDGSGPVMVVEAIDETAARAVFERELPIVR